MRHYAGDVVYHTAAIIGKSTGNVEVRLDLARRTADSSHFVPPPTSPHAPPGLPPRVPRTAVASHLATREWRFHAPVHRRA